MPTHTPDHSPMGGAGVLTGTTFAFLLDHSLGDLLLADLDEMVGARRVGLDPATTAGAVYGVNACVVRLAAGYLDAGVWKFGMVKVLVGLPENSPNASEGKKQKKRN